MLRLTDIDRTPTATTPFSRAMIPGLLVTTALVVAGVRGPSGGISSAADPKPDVAALKDVASAKPGPTFDPALIPSDAVLVAGFRPADLIKLPELKALLEEFTREAEMKFVSDMAEPESIEQVAFVVLKRDFRLGQDLDEQDMINSGLVIVRTNKPREWKALALIGGIMSQKVTHLGKDYYRLADGDSKGAFSFAYYQVDDMTVVGGSEANIKAVIARDKPQTDPRWCEAVRQAERGHGFLALDVSWAREQMNALKGLSRENEELALLTLALAPTAPLQELVDRQVVTLDGAEGLAIDSRNFCRDEAGAERVRRTIDALLILGQNTAGGPLDPFRDMLRKEAGPLAPLIDLGEQALKDGRVDREGTTVRFRTAIKGPLVQKLRPIVEGM